MTTGRRKEEKEITTIRHVTKQGCENIDIFSHEMQEKRRIRMTGEVDYEMADEAIAKLQYLDSISNKEIEVIIHSPGGMVSAGMAILDAMKELKSDIRTICSGECASAAAVLIACGGTKGKREIYPNAEMMIHQPLGGASGQATDVMILAERLANTKKKVAGLLAEATGQPLETIQRDMERDKWMDAKEAVAYGLVDQVRSPRER